ncbi:MAG: hypothetical protein HYT34_02480 [Candidatus Ryanbacteria bacterium]|nr:hypothetical protein [Candidatus Ryanbacteria bacterium]
MLVLLIIFAFAFAGVIILPLRHLAEARKLQTPTEIPQSSILRVLILGFFNFLERWYHERAKDEGLKAADSFLHLFEKGAGRLAGHTKKLRLMVQERFRIIPRESLYWKQIHSWKEENGTRWKGALEDFDMDISNHPDETRKT